MARRYALPRSRSLHQILQFKVTLARILPPVWRRVQIASETRLSGLHEILQTAFGWMDCHMHYFTINGQFYEEPDPEDDEKIVDESSVYVGSVAKPGDKFAYEYDPGDDWNHIVEYEQIVKHEKGAKYPRCVDGARAAPPDDCGGTDRYFDLLEALRNPSPKTAEFVEWAHNRVGGHYDPEHFDINAVNRQFRRLARAYTRG